MDQPNDIPAMKQDVENALEKLEERHRHPLCAKPVENREAEVFCAAPFAPPPLSPIGREADTEYLLNGLIAEMHYIMRELTVPSAASVKDADTRLSFITSSIELAQAAAKVGKTVAGLRAASQPRAARTTTETVELVGAAPKNC